MELDTSDNTSDVSDRGADADTGTDTAASEPARQGRVLVVAGQPAQVQGEDVSTEAEAQREVRTRGSPCIPPPRVCNVRTCCFAASTKPPIDGLVEELDGAGLHVCCCVPCP